jgi:hypothetical protein
MTHRPTAPCVLCTYFHRHAEAPPAHGYCEGYERMRRHDDTNEACPLWNRAEDEQRRRAWAEQQPKEKN